MNNFETSSIDDAGARAAALDASRSFVVQAPAGSGKTTLLTQRLLVLLATVADPEQVVAITFTRKAAEEMRARIVEALDDATRPEPEDPFKAATHRLARAVLKQDAARGWQLGAHPARLRILTIDALCQGIVRQAPIAARLASAQHIEEDAGPLYREAAREAIAEIAGQGPWQAPLTRLLAHFDNDWQTFESLLAAMLGRRDQWLPLFGTAWSREVLEASFGRVMAAELAPLRAAFARPGHADMLRLAAAAGARLATSNPDAALARLAGITAWPPATATAVPRWRALADLFLTGEGEWRKTVDKRQGFPADKKDLVAVADKAAMLALLADLRAADSGLRAVLRRAQGLPATLFGDGEAEIVEALLAVLKLACAQLQVQGANSGRVDFSAYALAALDVLGTDDAPSELALRLDYRLQHLLVDECQDTSVTQYALLLRLTAGWSADDGRTVFLVGDPMQSIYRFRQAEVHLFTGLLERGMLGDVPLTRLELSVNFRAQAGLVAWINAVMPPALAALESAGVPFVAQHAVRPALPESWHWHPSMPDDRAGEAADVVATVEALLAADPDATIAILVRARGHLGRVTSALVARGHALAARELEPLAAVPAVADLMALTRALLHAGDRLAWLAVLRAPWCGARLATLEAFADRARTVPALLEDAPVLDALPGDERRRVQRAAAVLLPALSLAGRVPLAELVEQAWVALGGPALLAMPGQAADVRVYLDHVADLERAPTPLTAAALEARLAGRHSSAPPRADARIHVMTVHRAKGLEFDYVLVPGCTRRARPDGRPLLRWREDLDAEGARSLLLAPSPARGSSELYDYLQARERAEAQAEAVRLLYVALTRAKRAVHLFGQLAVTADGVKPPVGSAFLAMLWPALAPDLPAAPGAAAPALAGEGMEEASVPGPPPPLRRFDEASAAAPRPRVVLPPPSDEPLVEFDWAGTTARHIGTVAHRLLQGGGCVAPGWSAAAAAFTRGQLRALGVGHHEIEEALAQVGQAVTRTLASIRGRWLFEPTQREVETELALSVRDGGGTQRLVIDRTFVDADGQRWIVDFKTGRHAGGGVEAYLDSELVRYRPQLERYGRAMAALDPRPIRLGLYFPLLDGWREWALEAQPATDSGQ